MSLISYITRWSKEAGTRGKVLRNLFWATLAKIINIAGSLFVGIIVARYLGSERYGIMNYVISFVTLFQVLAYFGLDDIQIREEANNPAKRDEIIGTTFALRILFAVIVFFIIGVVVFSFESDGYIRTLILLYAFSIFLNTFNVIRNHFTAIVWNEYVAKTEMSRTVIGAAVKMVLLLLKASLTWFVVSLVFDTFLLTSGYIISYRKKIDVLRKWTFNREYAKYLIHQSFPLLLSGAALVAYQRIDQVLIGNLIADKSSLGYFAVADKFVELILFVPLILSQTIAPLLVSTYKNEPEQYQHKARLFMNITLWGCIVLALLMHLLSYPVVAWTFGENFLPAIPVLQILAFKVIGAALSQTSGQLIIIEGRQRYVVLRNLSGCLVCVFCNLWLIPQMGIIGSAIVAILTVMVSGFLIHSIIPVYRKFFTMQLHSLLFGWKDLINVRMLFR